MGAIAIATPTNPAHTTPAPPHARTHTHTYSHTFTHAITRPPNAPRRLLISIPLSYSGGVIAAKSEIRQYPTRTNQIPRHIPPPHWASHPLVLFFAAGLLPFGTIFVELYFAMTSMWQVGGGGVGGAGEGWGVVEKSEG